MRNRLKLVALLTTALVVTAIPAQAQTAAPDKDLAAGLASQVLSATESISYEVDAVAGASGESPTGLVKRSYVSPGFQSTAVADVTCLAVKGRHTVVIGRVRPAESLNVGYQAIMLQIHDATPEGKPDGVHTGVDPQIGSDITFDGCEAFLPPADFPAAAVTTGDFNVVDAIPSGPDAVVLTASAVPVSVGSEHAVPAVVTTATGAPSAGVPVRFTVSGAAGPAQGSCLTDSNGRCSFAYQGPKFPGTDTITGCADSDQDGTRDDNEPCNVVTQNWALPASTPGKVAGGGQLTHADGTGVTFAFTFASDGTAMKGNCLFLDHDPATNKVDCVNVVAYAQAANEVTVYGHAVVNGAPAGLFRLKVVDNSEALTATNDVVELETQSGYKRVGAIDRGIARFTETNLDQLEQPEPDKVKLSKRS